MFTKIMAKIESQTSISVESYVWKIINILKIKYSNSN